MSDGHLGAHGFDIIGDVHGCVNTLQKLLKKMDYQKVNGVFEHRSRKAVFIGDIIDRGPHIREALHLVRDMVDRGSARTVMGNHEYNALLYCTRSQPKTDPPQYLREHNRRNERILHETLEQFAHYQQEWHEFLQWFREMPVFIEEDHFRVVHACWDDQLISEFRKAYPDGVIDEEFLLASAVRRSFASRVMDRLLRGTDMPLPAGVTITSDDGYRRSFFRTKFWSIDPQTYNDVVYQPDQLPLSLQQQAISQEEKKRLVSYGADEIPVFVGHYWLKGTPAPVRGNVGCLDYSAVKNGKLVAYRMDTEKQLDQRKYVWERVSNEVVKL